MTLLLNSVSEILTQFDVAVLDQYGVLHNGVEAYPNADSALRVLANAGVSMVVVSNSGKRADFNRQRIASRGLTADLITSVVTSGEILWEDFAQETVLSGPGPWKLLSINGAAGDAEAWRAELTSLIFVEEVSEADAVVLMGLPDGDSFDEFTPMLRAAYQRRLPVICSNPDRRSPAPGQFVRSPGNVAAMYEDMGGTVLWYGKPYPRIYEAVRSQFPEVSRDRFLMVGDSVEHDVQGAQGAGFRSLFVRNGIHVSDFEDIPDTETTTVINSLSTQYEVRPPDYSIAEFG